MTERIDISAKDLKHSTAGHHPDDIILGPITICAARPRERFPETWILPGGFSVSGQDRAIIAAREFYKYYCR